MTAFSKKRLHFYVEDGAFSFRNAMLSYDCHRSLLHSWVSKEEEKHIDQKATSEKTLKRSMYILRRKVNNTKTSTEISVHASLRVISFSVLQEHSVFGIFVRSTFSETSILYIAFLNCVYVFYLKLYCIVIVCEQPTLDKVK